MLHVLAFAASGNEIAILGRQAASTKWIDELRALAAAIAAAATAVTAAATADAAADTVATAATSAAADCC